MSWESVADRSQRVMSEVAAKSVNLDFKNTPSTLSVTTPSIRESAMVLYHKHRRQGTNFAPLGFAY